MKVPLHCGRSLQQGFEATGEARPYRYDKLESTARLYEKRLAK